MTLITPTTSFLDSLKLAAEQAEAAEGHCRQEAARRIGALGRERAFAFRRLNLMRAMADAVAECDSEEIAVASGLAVLRVRLGWTTDSEPRAEMLSRFASVVQAVFRSFAASDDGSAVSVQDALSQFETWYGENHEAPFWVLFERYVPESPLVDF